MATTMPTPETKSGSYNAALFSIALLAVAYGLLGLSRTEFPGHLELMSRCVLMDEKLSRIWSVANVEVGLAYFGVFFGMLYYVLVTKVAREQHLRDLGLAIVYVVVSFGIDYVCVQRFQPFVALLIGDAAVMTFTLIVSRRLWFQRLLGVFVPLIFLTCGFGHLLEGMSFWKMTYPINVPWSMVTADIGFAVLVNSSRFPAFIRGQDIQEEMFALQARQREQTSFFHSVLFAVTDGKLQYHDSIVSMPINLPKLTDDIRLSRTTLSDARSIINRIGEEHGFSRERIDALSTAGGEAMMNAVVHAEDALLSIRGDNSRIQLIVADHGSGIAVDDLPKATLMKGWSSRGTLGMGFSLILSMADSVDLATGADGTIIAVTVNREPPASIRYAE